MGPIPTCTERKGRLPWLGRKRRVRLGKERALPFGLPWEGVMGSALGGRGSGQTPRRADPPGRKRTRE